MHKDKEGKTKNRKYYEGDFGIVLTTLLISLFGLVMVFSASYYKALSQKGNPTYFLKEDLIWVIGGWIVFFVVSRIDYHRFSYLAVLGLLVGLGLLVLIFTPLGRTYNNATRWLDFKYFTVMPGEVIKPCLILFVSWWFARKPERIKTWSGLLHVMGVAGVVFILIYKQPNLSTAGITLLMVFGMMFVAGLSVKLILLAVAVLGGGFAGILIIKGGYWLTRFTDFWDPLKDSLGSGFQVTQSLLAFGSGGIFGSGLGKSVQKALYLPEAHSDFILSIVGEELGLAGVLILLAAYFYLIWRCCLTAINAKDYFGTLMAGGVTLHLAIQVIINVAVVTASFPPTGVVLPLMSLGGSATLLFMGEMGILYNVSRQIVRSEK